MPEDRLRRILARRPQHRGPQCAMKARNVLADEVNVRRPVFVERRLVIPVADGGNVRQERDEPDVDGELGIERNTDAPLLALTRDVDVAQAFRLDQANDLVATAIGLNELRMLFEMLEQPLLKRGQFEKVAVLAA